MIRYLTAVVIAVSLLAAGSQAATPSASQWQADYGKALSATRKDDRPLLIVLDVPNDPQSAVEAKRLQADGQQAKLLGAYQLCHVDVSTEYGKRVAQAFRAKKFPFTAIIDKTGSTVLYKKLGQLSNEEWQATLAKYQKGLPTYHTSFYRGDANTSVNSPGYCPSCQRKAQLRAQQAH